MPKQIKWLFLVFAAVAPFFPLVTETGTPDRMRFQWEFLAVGLAMAIVLGFLGSRLFRFSDDEEGGLTERRTFGIIAISFVITGCVGYAKLRIVDRLYWHDDSIMFGMCVLLGLSILSAIALNKKLTNQ